MPNFAFWQEPWARGGTYANIYGYIGLRLREPLAVQIKQIFNELTNTNNLALADLFFQKADLQKAQSCFLKSLDDNKNCLNPQQFRNLAYTYYSSGDYPRSIACLDRALAIDPEYAEAWRSKALSLCEWQQFEESQRCYRKALELKPDDYLTVIGFIRLLIKLESLPEALSSCNRLLELRPDLVSGLCLKLFCLRSMKMDEEADILIDYLIEKTMSSPAAIPSLVNELIANKLSKDLLRICELRLSGLPNASCLYGKAYALYSFGDRQTALELCSQIVLKDDPSFEVLSLRGVIEYELGNLKEAEISYKKALKLKPFSIDIRWNLSLLHLSKGDYSRGLSLYESRYAPGSSRFPHLTLSTPRWCGGLANLKKPLLIVSEQGLGDTLQFIRYVKFITKELKINVVVAAQPALIDLLKCSGVANNVYSYLEFNASDVSAWIPLLSLPFLLGVRPGRALISSAYLEIPCDDLKKWQNIMRPLDKQILIGLHWQGNLEKETGALRGRSLALKDLLPLSEIKDVKFVILQKRLSDEQETEELSGYFDLIENQKMVLDSESFIDTGAQAKMCDIVITNDTAMAHLAGGLGVTTWVMLHNMPDWRWGTSGAKSFWYDSVMLFRQNRKNQWFDVVSLVQKKLENYVKKIIKCCKNSRLIFECDPKEALVCRSKDLVFIHCLRFKEFRAAKVFYIVATP